MGTPKDFAALSIAAILGFGAFGCATKKHVRGVVAPVEARVSDVEKKSADNTSAISQLENGLSRADERAMEADKKAVAAGQDATKANEAATQAGQRADNARELAEKGIARANEVEKNVTRTIDNLGNNLGNYRLTDTENVLFGFNRSELSDEGKAKLDQLAQELANTKNYVIEVQGYTDTSGPKDYNLTLSQKRADAVVRYLTSKHQIPLRRIHVLGIGEPETRMKTRAERKEGRKVELKVFVQDLKGGDRQLETRATTTPTK